MPKSEQRNLMDSAWAGYYLSELAESLIKAAVERVANKGEEE